MRIWFVSFILLAALPAAAKPIVVCGSEVALDIQRQAGDRFQASDCWREDTKNLRFDHQRESLMTEGLQIVTLKVVGKRVGGEVVTTAKAWYR